MPGRKTAFSRTSTLAGVAAIERLGETRIDPANGLLDENSFVDAAGGVIKAARVAVNRFAGPPKGETLGGPTIDGPFERLMDDTRERTASFARVIRQNQFAPTYRPVVEIATADLHHFEAPTRFGDGDSPFETIKLENGTSGPTVSGRRLSDSIRTRRRKATKRLPKAADARHGTSAIGPFWGAAVARRAGMVFASKLDVQSFHSKPASHVDDARSLHPRPLPADRCRQSGGRPSARCFRTGAGAVGSSGRSRS